MGTSQMQTSEIDVFHTNAATRSRAHVAYASYLRRAMDILDVSRNSSNQEIDTLIDKFIAAHTASQDHCPSELLEAKHQLNSLHKLIKDLSETVKSTEGEIQGFEEKK